MNRQADQQPSIVTGALSRRIALTGLAGSGLAAAVLAALGPNRAGAQASPTPGMSQGYAPNGFSLEGPDTHISYGTTSITGEPTLTYRGPLGERTFHGDEIRADEHRALGGLVSVVVEEVYDARVVWLTLLLPGFNPVELEDPPIPFSALAVLTTHLTSDGGPILLDGPLHTYEAVALTGTATFAIP